MVCASRNGCHAVLADHLKSFQKMAPTLRCRPGLVQGIPVARETRRLALVMPTARLQLKPPLFIGILLAVSAEDRFKVRADNGARAEEPTALVPHGAGFAARV